MHKTAQKHLDAIRAGTVTRENVIGLRKLINATENKARGYSIGATSCIVTLGELEAIEDTLERLAYQLIGQYRTTGAASFSATFLGSRAVMARKFWGA